MTPEEFEKTAGEIGNNILDATQKQMDQGGFSSEQPVNQETPAQTSDGTIGQPSGDSTTP
ncbi:MAG: hypothetical protein HQM08_14140 [Candidatus Riflebacteria bacterium]|nr:hypothetical protein [Candidatus Riflebacteria bacterium]